jgi:hypothetical protein
MLLVKYADVVAQDQLRSRLPLGRLIAQSRSRSHHPDARGIQRRQGAPAGRGVRAARLRTIKADILRNLSDGNLKITAVASRHGVSTRLRAQALRIGGDDVLQSCSRNVLRAVTAYCGFPVRRTIRVSSVAFERGSATCRISISASGGVYGATPSDIRAQARFCGGANQPHDLSYRRWSQHDHPPSGRAPTPMSRGFGPASSRIKSGRN